MGWKVYKIVLRLHSPMHIGQAKIGNIQRTRPYVTGRAFWGALTSRMTRDRQQGKGPATNSQLYQTMRDNVHEHLAFTYFYPTTDPGGNVDPWPWDRGFRPRFLRSYAGTALSYPQQSADEGTLHEVEFISPRTLDSGEQVYLAGYIFAQEGAPEWQSALCRLQLGGERTYGWGRVARMSEPKPREETSLFSEMYTVEIDGERPVLIAGEKARLLAHTGPHEKIKAEGAIEPLMGRETTSAVHFGVQVSEVRVYYAPGSKVKTGVRVRIGRYGIWEAV